MGVGAMVFLLAWVRALGRLLRRDGSVQEPARKPDHHCPSREGERVQKSVRTIALDKHEPGCVGGLPQALPGFPAAPGVVALAGGAGVALARLTERLAHTRPVQLSCLVAVDHVLDSSLAAGSTTRHAAVSRRPC